MNEEQVGGSYLKPMNSSCSQSQESTSMMTILGKAKPNQLAKLMMSGLLG